MLASFPVGVVCMFCRYSPSKKFVLTLVEVRTDPLASRYYPSRKIGCASLSEEVGADAGDCAAGKQPADSASDERPDCLQSRFEHSCPVDFKFHVLFPFLSVLFFDLTPMAAEGLRYHYAWSFAL